MNDSGNLLSDGIKHLAASPPEEAPRRIAANLEIAFRRHHLRRKRIRVMKFTAIAALLLLSAVSWMRWRIAPHGGQGSAQVLQSSAPAAHDSTAGAYPAPAMPTPVLPNTAPPRQRTALARQRSFTADHHHSAGGKFIFMPGVDPETPAGSLIVVRVELPTSALGLVGLPASGDSSQDRVLADILMDQDGTPYAIRIANGAD
jgi:hypothetical protein